MNERIKQLALEARIYVNLNDNPWHNWMSDEEYELTYKKFAQLIVQECIKICNKGTATQTTCNGAAIMIAQHFGVEKI